jgi:hypothetical protein
MNVGWRLRSIVLSCRYVHVPGEQVFLHQPAQGFGFAGLSPKGGYSDVIFSVRGFGRMLRLFFLVLKVL